MQASHLLLSCILLHTPIQNRLVHDVMLLALKSRYPGGLQETAQQLMSYMRDGMFVDEATQYVAAEFAAYNPHLKYLARSVTEFECSLTGFLRSTVQVEVLRVPTPELANCMQSSVL